MNSKRIRILPGKPPKKVFVVSEGRGKFRHLMAAESADKVLSYDSHTAIGIYVGEYRLVRLHKLALKVERIN
mgnify:CR=1 FL=1